MTLAHLAQAGVLGPNCPTESPGRFDASVPLLARIAALADGVRLAARLVDAPPNEMHTDAMVGGCFGAGQQCLMSPPKGSPGLPLLKNDDSPAYQVEEAGAVLQRLRQHEGVAISVIRGEELREKGFGGLYGVGKAAERPPAMVVLSSKAGGGGGEQSVVFVGKGIVYDTGGLSIKTKVMNVASDRCRVRAPPTLIIL